MPPTAVHDKRKRPKFGRLGGCAKVVRSNVRK
jgi:hypothetical protein